MQTKLVLTSKYNPIPFILKLLSPKTMLSGPALLEFVKTNPEMPREEMMKLTGYSSTSESGRTTYKTADFMAALLEAQGISIPAAKKSAAGGGRQPTYKTTCMTNGNIVVGKSYFAKLGAKSGDAYEVTISNKKIVLKPVK